MNLSDLKMQVSVPANTKAVAKQVLMAVGVVGLTMIATTAFGAGFEESAQKADNLFKEILKWATILAGSAGAVYLLIKFVQAWNGHSDWMDFLKFAFFYACAGGVATIAAYIFGAFK